MQELRQIYIFYRERDWIKINLDRIKDLAEPSIKVTTIPITSNNLEKLGPYIAQAISFDRPHTMYIVDEAIKRQYFKHNPDVNCRAVPDEQAKDTLFQLMYEELDADSAPVTQRVAHADVRLQELQYAAWVYSLELILMKAFYHRHSTERFKGHHRILLELIQYPQTCYIVTDNIAVDSRAIPDAAKRISAMLEATYNDEPFQIEVVDSYKIAKRMASSDDLIVVSHKAPPKERSGQIPVMVIEHDKAVFDFFTHGGKGSAFSKAEIKKGLQLEKLKKMTSIRDDVIQNIMK